MTGAILLLTVGGLMVYSSIKGLSITDMFKGVVGDTIDPKGGFKGSFPAPASDPTANTTPGSPATGQPGEFIAEADRMIAFHHAYSWGGGHINFSPNGPWDCSGAMSQLCHALGLLNSMPLVSTEFMHQGIGGRGKVFTIYANPVHVFAIMESGPRKGQAWGTTSRLPSEGGSLRWHQHTTGGFVARHYDGW